MKQLIAGVAAVTVFAGVTVLGRQAAAPAAIAIRAARLIDGRGGAPVAPAVVVVRGERIESVGTSVPQGARVVDLGGATILPGLIDLHTHLTSTGVHWEDELVKNYRLERPRRDDRARPVRGYHRRRRRSPARHHRARTGGLGDEGRHGVQTGN